MADIAYVKSFLGGIDAAIKRAVSAALEYILDNLTIGAVEDGTRADNFQWYFRKLTTPGTANQEFSVTHSLGRKPRLLIPILPLDVQGAKLVPLEVSEIADESRVYLKSSETNATTYVLIE